MHGPLSHFCNHRNNFACDLVKLCACKQNHMPLLWLLLPVHWEAGCNGISQGHVPLHRCTCGNDHPRLQQPHMEMCWLVRFMEPWEQPPISIVLLILTYRTADFFSLHNLNHSLDSCRIMWVTRFFWELNNDVQKCLRKDLINTKEQDIRRILSAVFYVFPGVEWWCPRMLI